MLEPWKEIEKEREGRWKAERERDEALELLRSVLCIARGLLRDGTCTDVDEARLGEIEALLAKRQQPRGAACVHCGKLTTLGHLEPDCGDCRQPPSCERCGDKREVVMPEGGGVRTRYMAPCPDCAPCERRGGERRVTYSANDGLGGVDSRDIPCPDCAEGER